MYIQLYYIGCQKSLTEFPFVNKNTRYLINVRITNIFKYPKYITHLRVYNMKNFTIHPRFRCFININRTKEIISQQYSIASFFKSFSHYSRQSSLPSWNGGRCRGLATYEHHPTGSRLEVWILEIKPTASLNTPQSRQEVPSPLTIGRGEEENGGDRTARVGKVLHMPAAQATVTAAVCPRSRLVS